MFCPNCGHKLPDGSAFCDSCGAKITLRAEYTGGSTDQADVNKGANFNESDYYAADIDPAPAKKPAQAEGSGVKSTSTGSAKTGSTKSGSSKTGSAKSGSSKTGSAKAAAAGGSKTGGTRSGSAKRSTGSRPQTNPKKSAYDWDDDDDEPSSKLPLIIALLVAVIAIVLIIWLFLHSGSFNFFNRSTQTPAVTSTVSRTESLVFPTESTTSAPTETPTPTPTETPTPTPTETPTPTPTAEPTPSASDSIIVDSSDRLLTEDDLKNLTEEQVWYARNEIFARHGYTFANEELKAYFSTKSWYKPDPDLNASTEDIYGKLGLSETEITNIHFIQDYEASHNLNEGTR